MGHITAESPLEITPTPDGRRTTSSFLRTLTADKFVQVTVAQTWTVVKYDL